MFNFDEAGRQGKDAMDGMLKSYSELAKGFQAIATETGEYSRKSLQDMTSFMEALSGARSIEAVYDLQTGYAKSSYESFVAEASKLSEMYGDLAKTAYRPYEAPVEKSTALVVPNAA